LPYLLIEGPLNKQNSHFNAHSHVRGKHPDEYHDIHPKPATESTVVSYPLDKTKLDEMVVRFIISSLSPLHITENVELLKTLSHDEYLPHSRRLPSRQLDTLGNKHKLKISQLLAVCAEMPNFKIHRTFDHWTDHDSYLGVTDHFVAFLDGSPRLVSLVMALGHMPENHRRSYLPGGMQA